MSDEYINRELSWLEFNQRVLDQAVRTDLPLLERLKFLAITASNLDEFFMVRVGGLQMLRHSGSRVKDISGLTPTRQLKAIRSRVGRMIEDQYRLFHEEILPWMEINGINPLAMEDLSTSQKLTLEQYFNNQIFPLLTPLDMDAPEAPALPSLKLLMGVELRDNETGEVRSAVVALPDGLPRRVPVPSAEAERYVMLEDLVRECIGTVFPGETVLSAAVFRVTRNGDIAVQEEDALDLADEMEEVLVARKFSECVRLEIESSAPAPLHDKIMRIVGAGKEETYDLKGPLMLSDFMEMAFAPGNDQLKVEQWSPQPSPSVNPAVSIFENIAGGDILLNHPYESFEPVLRLVEEAAEDPDVIAIKQVLYRTARNSRIVAALKKAAESGKQVTALVELKARFDEENNINWAKMLEKAGCHVIYGLVGLKTHSKITLVVRMEEDGIRRYVHLGTGNYNDSTAKLYTDCGILTCNPQIGEDATAVFNMLSGYSEPLAWNKLSVAPLWLRGRFLRMIRREAEHAREGRPAHIMAKMNSLCDKEIITALYEASCAGVKVEMIIRGICCLKAGVPGLSENISVRSIVGNFLEHSRIFYFFNDASPEVYMGSADWMPRNLDRRVEIMFPVEDEVLREKVIHILEVELEDNVKAHILQPDGSYEKEDKRGKVLVNSQEQFCREAILMAKESADQEDPARSRVFKPVMSSN